VAIAAGIRGEVEFKMQPRRNRVLVEETVGRSGQTPLEVAAVDLHRVFDNTLDAYALGRDRLWVNPD
jgi:hypothetical protein